jgi:hypothetical protein
MVKFYNQVKVSNFTNSNLSQFNKKLLRNKRKALVELTSNFTREYHQSSVFDIIHIYRDCKRNMKHQKENSFHSLDHKNEKTSNKKNANSNRNSSFYLKNSIFSQGSTHNIKVLTSSIDDLRETIKVNYAKIENEVRKNSTFQLTTLKKFGVTKKKKFEIENYLFEVFDKVMLNVVLKLSALPVQIRFQTLGRLY